MILSLRHQIEHNLALQQIEKRCTKILLLSWLCSTRHENPRLDEDEEKSLCNLLHLSKQTHLALIKYKAIGGRSVPNKLNKLLVAVDTLLTGNADCEPGFIAINNIITDSRSMITAYNAADLLFIGIVGPPTERWDPGQYVKSDYKIERLTQHVE